MYMAHISYDVTLKKMKDGHKYTGKELQKCNFLSNTMKVIVIEKVIRKA